MRDLKIGLKEHSSPFYITKRPQKERLNAWIAHTFSEELQASVLQ
jgi:hypothetical protein